MLASNDSDGGKDSVIDTIDRMIEEMRERRAAKRGDPRRGRCPVTNGRTRTTRANDRRRRCGAPAGRRLAQVDRAPMRKVRP